MIWLNNSWTSETANIIRFRVVRTAGKMTVVVVAGCELKILKTVVQYADLLYCVASMCNCVCLSLLMYRTM